jgi:hypothetical protein
MATTSKVKKALVDVSTIISNERSACSQAKARISSAVSNLNSIPATFSDVITEINGYTPTGAFETLAKDELQKMSAEFQTLKTAAEGAVTDLGSITEF